jgi:hypothetical protein
MVHLVDERDPELCFKAAHGIRKLISTARDRMIALGLRPLHPRQVKSINRSRVLKITHASAAWEPVSHDD